MTSMLSLYLILMLMLMKLILMLMFMFMFVLVFMYLISYSSNLLGLLPFPQYFKVIVQYSRSLG